MSEPRPRTDARPADELTLGELADLARRHRRVLSLLPALGVAVAVAVTLLTPRTFSSGGSFLSKGAGASGSQLAGLASQFGINVTNEDPGASPQFYVYLLESREVLSSVLTRSFQHDGGSGPLLDYLEVDEEDPASRLEEGIEEFRRRITANGNIETGLVSYTVRLQGRELTRDVAEALQQAVIDFDLRSRNSQAREEREFVEGQLERARRELLEAENALKTFLENNRQFRSPDLVFQSETLQRRVDLRQQVVASLAQSLEQARIEEVRNTPVVTVVEPPYVPGRPDSRGGVLKVLVGLIAGAFLAVVVVVAREAGSRIRSRGAVAA